MSRPVIDRFVGDFAFLSNFYPSTVAVEGKLYPTVEHAYQALKTTEPLAREIIRKAATPGEAKRLGRTVEIRSDWNDIRLEVMRDLLIQKFANPFLRPMLLATEDAELIEGNHWNDRFWGVCRGEGQNHLGRLLMEVRELIRKEEVGDENISNR